MRKSSFRSFIAVILTLSLVTLSPGLPCYAALGDLFKMGARDAAPGKYGMGVHPITFGGGFDLNPQANPGSGAATLEPGNMSAALGLDGPDVSGISGFTGGIQRFSRLVFGGATQDTISSSASLPPDGPTKGFARVMQTLRSARSRMQRFTRTTDNGIRRGIMARIFGEAPRKGMDTSDASGGDTTAFASAPSASIPVIGARLRRFFGGALGNTATGEISLPPSPQGRDGRASPWVRTFPFVSTAVGLYTSARDHWAWIHGLLKLVADTGVAVKRKLAIASVLAVVTTALSSSTVYFYGKIAAQIPALSQAGPHDLASWSQALIHDASLRGFAMSATAMVSVFVAMGLCRYFFVKTTLEIGSDLSNAFFKKFSGHAIFLRMQWHRINRPGTVHAKSESALGHLQSVFTDAIIKPVNNGVLVLVALGGLLILCPWPMVLTILALYMLPAIVSLIWQPMLNKAFANLYCEGKPTLTRKLLAVLSNIKHIKAAGMEEHAIRSLDEASRRVHLEMGRDVIKVMAPLEALKDLAVNLANFGTLVVIVLASYFHYGSMEISRGFAVLMLAGNLGQVMQVVCAGLMNLAQGNGVTGQVQKILAEPQEEVQSDGGIVLPPAKNGREIWLRNVMFGYDEKEPVLRIDNLRIRPAEMTVIVGRSGSGKSSLIGLMAGLDQPNEGVLYVDQIDRRDLNARELRKDVVFIPKDVDPFDDTIFRNIAGPDPNATTNDVRNAAMKVGLHDEIMRLGGYDVKVGQNGIDLSTGQKMRLALARLRRLEASPPAVIIVDEPTASLDAANAKLVLETLEVFRGKSTIIVTTHDPAVAKAGNRIVVLSNGRVAEQNSHEPGTPINNSHAMTLEEPKQ